MRSRKMDHLAPLRGAPIIGKAVADMRFGKAGASPLQALCKSVQDRATGVVSAALDGKIVLVNRKGAFCTLGKNMEIVSRRPYAGEFSDIEHILMEGSRVVCLENDPDPEKPAIAYMANRWGKYSVILCLREQEATLSQTLKDMRRNGIEAVYVYTTGGDVPQMYAYLDSIAEAGIKHLVMHFVGGEKKEHIEFVDKAKDRGVDVECEFLNGGLPPSIKSL